MNAASTETTGDLPPVDDRNDLPAEDRDRPTVGWVGWLISTGVHALLLLLMYVVVMGVVVVQQDPPAVRVAVVTAPPPPPDKKEKHTLEAQAEVTIVSESETPQPITALDMPVEVAEAEEEKDSPNPKGREEAVASSEMGGQGAFMAIGASGGASGMFGMRQGAGRRRAVGMHGGSKASESAVEAGLRWLSRHQSQAGHWPLMTYQNNCQEDGPKCEPAERHRGPSDDIGITGLALLCFLGAGYDHIVPSKHKQVVRKAVDMLVAAQGASGEFMQEGRPHNYAQAMAVMALAEAYAMTGDQALRPVVEKGVQVILARRVPATAAGPVPWVWGDFTESKADGMATSSSSWNLQALKSCIAAGIDVGNGWDSGKQWLNAIWRASTVYLGKDPDRLDPYTDETGLAYRYNPETSQVSHFSPRSNTHDLGCIGLLIGLFQGRAPGDPMISTLANYEMRHHLPTAYPCNNYYAYYNTLAFFQIGGEAWKTWNGSVRDIFVNSQRSDPGCFDGSWDPGQHFSAQQTGRPLSTVLNILILEVYYRYALIHGADISKAGDGKAGVGKAGKTVGKAVPQVPR
ncbi:hypothetical protein LBMAG53_15800 [Planctomycetota bacterium]|nr:hypothetical protein LBMAG53_15800 [Planctomycetota bacterium]